MFFAGPVEAGAVHDRWSKGQPDDHHFAVIYLRQFLDLQRSLDATAWAYSARAGHGGVDDPREGLTVRYLPVPAQHGNVASFIAGRLAAGLRIVALAARHRPDAVVVDGAHTFWFALAPLRALGVTVIPTIHCVLWLRHRPRRRRLRRLMDPLDGWFFGRVAGPILVVSEEIGEQVRELAGAAADVRRFVPSYPPGAFDHVAPPEPDRRPFEVLFAGRIAKDKGVGLLLEAAAQLAAAGRDDITITLCGEGPALDGLRARATEMGLAGRFTCLGFCERDELAAAYGRAHVVVAPTTTAFVEGFNKVVLEGVLSGRPVITSSTCPALSDVAEAVLEVAPDDAVAYRRAFEALCDDRQLYEAKRAAAVSIAATFDTDDRSWQATLRRALADVGIR